MKNILIICTGNTCRSPMAEGIIKNIIGETHMEDITVKSMGLSAYDGDSASNYAVEALKEIGIDIKRHRSRRVLLPDLLEASIIYVMTQQHKNVILEACNEVEDRIRVIDIPDPFGQDISQYKTSRDLMLRFFKKEWKEKRFE